MNVNIALRPKEIESMNKGQLMFVDRSNVEAMTKLLKELLSKEDYKRLQNEGQLYLTPIVPTEFLDGKY